MERRAGLLWLFPALLALYGAFTACGGTADTGNTDSGMIVVMTDAGPGVFTFSSTVVNSHVHDLTLTDADLLSPPPSGLIEDSTVAAAHFHQVTFTANELNSLQQGTTLTKATSINNGHDHNFTFSRP